jgi:hypothetical protein
MSLTASFWRLVALKLGRDLIGPERRHVRERFTAGGSREKLKPLILLERGKPAGAEWESETRRLSRGFAIARAAR